MPRGVPAAGYRKTKGWRARGGKAAAPQALAGAEVNDCNSVPVESTETDEQIWAKLADRFEILEELAELSFQGKNRALIVSGPAGLSKSYTVEEVAKRYGDPRDNLNYTFVKGYVKPTGLYKKLYDFRNAGQVVVFDDADSVFGEELSLNFLKAVLDTTERRVVSYLAETTLVSTADGAPIPETFEFEGSCIFITNYDFDAMIAKGHKIAPHLNALVSRSHYIDLAMKTRRDYFIRILQVVEQGLFKDFTLTKNQEKEVLDFIEKNIADVRELSLRTALKCASVRQNNKNWEKVARVTLLRNK